MNIISNEPIYNKEELINILKKTEKDANEEIYIYDTNIDEYSRITLIRIDDDGDLIIEIQSEE